ncbi:PHD finger protein MALE MEIOCYTE DEATH 1 [Striga hermonthica]|uniref:PHD finger protein MALE MEIOCYTE DEATH 1 n=1 Tax=Striga hermonthica TaxID=68872 RepID=A0A9N7NSD5_STRHE|nr:PHD finger protein MALE MEIOCYTE DEATH 1 [Striga hermonthica]
MAGPNPDSHSKRNKKMSKFYGFHSFAEAGVPVSLDGAFRDNVRQFLLQCAEPEDYSVDGMPVWCTFLVYESKGTVLPLYTVEENVKHSDKPFCEYCRSSGWSHHFVSSRKYRLIIPGNEDWNNPLDEGAFDQQTHLLHGLIHCNGSGHLICINGVEGGSKYICGGEIMDLWDRICTTLQVRQISVEDLSRKHNMDLRLLHGVAYGHSWFGKWGYRFSRGSFGVKEHNYESAMDVFSSLGLEQVMDDFSFTSESTPIKQMIHHYRGMSETNLVTIRDLFRFMLTLKTKPPARRCSVTPFMKPARPEEKETSLPTSFKQCSLKTSSRLAVRPDPPGKEKKTAKCRKFSNLAANMDSRWPVRRLQHVAEVIVEALREKRAKNRAGSCGMTRQEARDAARVEIGDTGLIDHVLKAMNNVIVGNYVVCRAVNKSTKILEYTIHDHHKDEKNISTIKTPNPVQAIMLTPGRSVIDDLKFLYNSVLLGYPDPGPAKFAAQMILYSKHFVKEWPFRDEDDHTLRFICRLTTSSFDLMDDISRDYPPRELVIVPLHATLGELKIAVQNAMRDTYYVTEGLVVTEILETEGVEDEEVLFGLVESGREIWARGYGLDMGEGGPKYEGGSESWTVKCRCGARDDDGERMVSCDICEAWQHTLCSGIEDSEAVPRLFVCDSCCSTLAPERVGCGFMNEYDSYENPMTMMMMPEVDMRLLY